MATLMIEYTGKRITGRCDARCYDAKHEDCHCICGGSNHGKGQAQAMENTAKHALDMVQEWNTAQDLGIIDAEARPGWTWGTAKGILAIRQDPPEQPKTPLFEAFWDQVMPEPRAA